MQSGKHNTRLLFAAASIAFSLAASDLFAADYYVDIKHPSASDSNPGTEVLPWKTPYAATLANLQPGDTVYVKAGVYEMRTGGNWDRPVINPKNSGQPGAPITFRSLPRHGAILQNSGAPILGASGRNYITVDGFVVKNAWGKGMIIYGGDYYNPVKGNIIENNIIQHVWSESATDNTDGIRVENAMNSIIRNNKIFDIHNGTTNHNAAAVKMYGNTGSIIENNEVYDCGSGIYDKDGGKNNTIRRNYVHDCADAGVRVHSNQTFVSGNQVYQNISNRNGFGFAITGSVDETLVVYNNVFANYRVSGMQGPNEPMGGRHRFYNNIFYQPMVGPIALYAYDDPVNHIAASDFNLFHSDHKWQIGRYVTNRWFNSLAAWQAGTKLDLHSFVANPGFVDAANGDFRLTSGSPARAAGRAGGLPTGTPVDIGAYPTGTEKIGIVTEGHVPAAPVLTSINVRTE